MKVPVKDEKALTREILERVRELVAGRQAAEPPFVPGESAVRYAGRVYGAEEVVNLQLRRERLPVSWGNDRGLDAGLTETISWYRNSLGRTS
jgi:hypothetical protein